MGRIRWWDWEEDLICQSIRDIQNGDIRALEKISSGVSARK